MHKAVIRYDQTVEGKGALMRTLGDGIRPRRVEVLDDGACPAMFLAFEHGAYLTGRTVKIDHGRFMS